MTLRISSNFDSGAIEVLSIASAGDIRLRLRADQGVGGDAAFRQWFHFRLHGAAGQEVRMVFENAAAAAYPDGWPGYRCVASYDRRHWFRIATTRYEDGQLIVEHRPERDSVYYAYFEPYSHERHLDLLGRVELSPFASVSNLGATVEGRDLDLVTVGRAAPGKQPVWIIARQHPGESMAEWFMEGLIERLEQPDDALRALLAEADLYLVPHMNPDGSFLGNLRTNAAGQDLNRARQAPSAERSPEVLFVQQQMARIGVDCFLDIHGDEEIPHVFTAGCEGNPGFSPRLDALEQEFRERLVAAGEFQTAHGYPRDEPGQANLALACNWVGQTYDCLAFTVEMPFKDHDDNPQPRTGWNGARSKGLARAVLSVLAALAPRLR